PSLRELQHPTHHAGDALPIFRFVTELFAASLSDRIKLRLAIVLRRAPGSQYPASLERPNEGSVNRSLIELQHFLADLFNAAGDSVAVQRSNSSEGLEHHQIEGALQNLGSIFRHR